MEQNREPRIPFSLFCPPPQVTVSLIFAISIATIGSFQFGYNTGVINAPETIIKDFLNYTLEEKSENLPTEVLLTSLWSLSGAIFSVGGMIGSFSVGLCQPLWQAFVPMYIGEISPTALRGAFGTLNQLGIVIGILVAQIFGLKVIMGTEELWPLLLGFTIIPAVLQSTALPFCPESPRFLLINRKEEENAKEILQRLWGTQDVSQDIQEMKDESARMAQEKQVTVLELFRSRSYRQPIIISIMLQLSQQLSGINAMRLYNSFDQGEIGNIFMILASTLLLALPERQTSQKGDAPRTPTCSGDVRISGLAVALVFNSISTNTNYFVCIGAILVFVAFFEIGPGPIPWFIVAELFSQGPRPAAMAVAGCSNWTSNFLVGLLFPSAAFYLGAYVFIIFNGFLIVFLVFTFFKVPEVHGRTFEEVTRAFEGQAQDANRAEKGPIVEMNSMQPVKETATV
ncbi:unnamed protein product [Nyctereutes procyonoides]|uniref:(raccoon dog) hypothetical protein n=1 Tax=Nyctereutes procyonoides TaxID=34880 RepID=A0A811YPR6_NYCPR|nr:unnamed protein product [Nyctereutes procyonoides]